MLNRKVDIWIELQHYSVLAQKITSSILRTMIVFCLRKPSLRADDNNIPVYCEQNVDGPDR